jgi:hypothetical protein
VAAPYLSADPYGDFEATKSDAGFCCQGCLKAGSHSSTAVDVGASGVAKLSMKRRISTIICAVLWSIFFDVTICLVACSHTHPQPDSVATTAAKNRPSLACSGDAECPTGERCGFRGDKFGECVVPSSTPHCFDPGGRCGCDGRPVEMFCGASSGAEYTSAPACFVGPCPMPCNDDMRCPLSLTCQNGQCGKRLP